MQDIDVDREYVRQGNMLKQYWKKGQKAVRILKKNGIVGMYYVLHYKFVEVTEFQRQFQ